MGNSSGAGPVSSSVIRALMDEAINIPVSERHLHQTRKEKKKAKVLRPKRPDSCAQKLPVQAVPESRIDKMCAAGGMPTVAHHENPNSSKKSNTKNHRAISSTSQEIALEAYTGVYKNAGYRVVTVTIRSGKLFIDARDRSTWLTLIFEHLKDQTKYIACLSDVLEGGSESVDAEFIFQNGRAVRFGLDLEPAVRDLIWFDFVAVSASA